MYEFRLKAEAKNETEKTDNDNEQEEMNPFKPIQQAIADIDKKESESKEQEPLKTTVVNNSNSSNVEQSRGLVLPPLEEQRLSCT